MKQNIINIIKTDFDKYDVLKKMHNNLIYFVHSKNLPKLKSKTQNSVSYHIMANIANAITYPTLLPYRARLMRPPFNPVAFNFTTTGGTTCTRSVRSLIVQAQLRILRN